MRLLRPWAMGTIAIGATLFVAAGLGMRTTRQTPQMRFEPNVTQDRIVGRVVSGGQPVAGATVRIRGEAAATLTDEQGRFALALPQGKSPPWTIAAWKEGFFIAGAAWVGEPLTVSLVPLPTDDCAEYAWVDPTPDPAGQHHCANCHEQIYREWQASGHAQAATNRRFVNFYDGTDGRGRPGYGWSLLDEHPLGAGVCAACHAPTVAFDHAATRDLRQVDGVAAHGVHCDFCHKVQEVELSHVGLTHGRFGMKLLRPREGQLFFGPLDDVTREEDAFSPMQRESRYCAACHEGVVFGVHVYSTYSEWLESPARRQGRQCQSCHMTPTGTMTNMAPGAGGVERDPSTLASHALLPGGREAMLRRCLQVEIDCRREGDGAQVRVTVAAKHVGHRVPTGFIDRHLILVVEPLADGEPATPLETGDHPLLPAAAGRDLAGKPGRLFAKLLADEDGRPLPFWRGGADPVDTRLAPEEPIACDFSFAHADRVRVRLLYRRFWEDAAREKAWPDETIVVVDRTVAPR